MRGTRNGVATESRHLETTDRELVERARAGDPSAFHELLDRHAGFLYSMAVPLVGNAADAEDVVQETLLGAYRGLRAFEGRASVRTWLAAILIRQAALRRRHERKRMAASAQAATAVEGSRQAPSAATAADARIDVTAAIQGLSRDHREVIVLRELHGMSYDEMAQALGVPRGTVESRLWRARRQLQERLKEYLA